ncbi:MAG: polyketide cyclase [Ignavibacteria bacterium]|nr:polyketide cyclase [Ignavibacteria bacterium]
MRVLKYILLALLSLVVLFFLISLILPTKYQVSRSITIQAPIDSIYDNIIDLNRWDRWVRWTHEVDNTLKKTYELNANGEKVAFRWASEKFGTGKIHITKSVHNNLIEYNLLVNYERFSTKGKFTFVAAKEGIEVTWFNFGELHDPISRYIGLFMDSMLGPDFEYGLKKLQYILEKH